MSYKNQQPAISRPLLIALVVVGIIGVIYFVTTLTGGAPEDDVSETGGLEVPESVRNLPPATPQPGEPPMSGMGGR
jgi:hypothetical protein